MKTSLNEYQAKYQAKFVNKSKQIMKKPKNNDNVTMILTQVSRFKDIKNN